MSRTHHCGSNRKPKDAREDREKKGEQLILLVTVGALLPQAAVLVLLWRKQYIAGIRGVLLALGYLLAFWICIQQSDLVSRTIGHVLFFLLRLGLFKHMFGSKIITLVLLFVATSIISFLFKWMRDRVIDKYGLSWYKPMGMG